MFKVALIHPNATKPQRKSSRAAGVDLHSCEDLVIPATSRKLVSTGLQIEIPDTCYARIAPRSGLAVGGVDVGAGVVDSDYRGEVKVLIINNKNTEYSISVGDRIAQLVLESIYTDDFTLVDEDDLNKTDRGDGGFGSTGK